MRASDGGPDGVAYLTVSTADVQAAAAPAGGLEAFLSPLERASSLRFRRAEDRLDYAASHALFRLLAAWRLGGRVRSAAGLDVRRQCISCGSTEHGKPWVKGVALSLSRSQGLVMAAAGPDGLPLGADIEKVPAEIFPGFDEYAVAASELPGPDAPGLSDVERIQLWVAKEAVLKAAGLGLALDPSAVALLPAASPGAGVPAGRGAGLWRAGSPGNPSVDGLLAWSVPAPDGFAAAVAAGDGAPGRPVSLSEILATKL